MPSPSGNKRERGHSPDGSAFAVSSLEGKRFMSCSGKSLWVRPGLPASLLAACFVLFLSCFLPAATRADDKADAQKKQREETYRAIFQGVKPEGLRSTVETLAKSRSRVAGYPGDSVEAAGYIKAQFDSILGKE